MTRILFFGDSITAGVFVPESLRYSSLVLNGLRSQGIAAEGNNAGVPGETSVRGKERLPGQLEAKPDLVTIAYGMNDSVLVNEGEFRVTLEQYRSAVQDMVSAVQRIGASPMLLTIPPVLDWFYYERHPKQYYDPHGGVNEVIASYNATLTTLDVPVVDIYQPFMTDIERFQRGDGDGVHPNEAGHRLIADLLLPVLIERVRM